MTALRTRWTLGKFNAKTASRTSALTRSTHALKALYQHWIKTQCCWLIDKCVKYLVVTRSRHIELFTDCLFLGASEFPPLAFEFKNALVALRQNIRVVCGHYAGWINHTSMLLVATDELAVTPNILSGYVAWRYQISSGPARGLEPLTPCLQDRCATNCATPASGYKSYAVITTLTQSRKLLPKSQNWGHITSLLKH